MERIDRNEALRIIQERDLNEGGSIPCGCGHPMSQYDDENGEEVLRICTNDKCGIAEM